MDGGAIAAGIRPQNLKPPLAVSALIQVEAAIQQIEGNIVDWNQP